MLSTLRGLYFADDYSTLLEGSVSRPAYELEPLKSVDSNSVEQTVDIWSLTNAGTVHFN